MKIPAQLVALGMAISPFGLVAADNAPDETIIVTATRTEAPLSDAIVPVTVIGRDDIELSMAADLAELLRVQAGIDIGRNGGPGQATSVFLRGTESNHTLVLVDGVRINPGTIGGAAVQHIAPELIERVEIVQGCTIRPVWHRCNRRRHQCHHATCRPCFRGNRAWRGKLRHTIRLHVRWQSQRQRRVRRHGQLAGHGRLRTSSGFRHRARLRQPVGQPVWCASIWRE